MNLQSVIDQIAAQAGLEPQVAERVAGTVLSVIQQEIDPAVAASVFAKLPGAAELARANAVSAGTNWISSLASSALGAKAGVLAAGLTQLQGFGLSLTQIETAGSTLLGYVKANAGAGLAAKVAHAIPGSGKAAA